MQQGPRKYKIWQVTGTGSVTNVELLRRYGACEATVCLVMFDQVWVQIAGSGPKLQTSSGKEGMASALAEKIRGQGLRVC